MLTGRVKVFMYIVSAFWSPNFNVKNNSILDMRVLGGFQVFIVSIRLPTYLNFAQQYDPILTVNFFFYKLAKLSC